MDVARTCMIKLLMHFISQWSSDRHYDSPGDRLHSFLSHQNKNKRIYDELNKYANLNKEALLLGDGLRFQHPVKIELLDITSLCHLLGIDVDQFPTRLAKHRRNGVTQLICQRYGQGHLAGCCSSCCGGKCTKKCRHHESIGERNCNNKKCGKPLKQCIAETAPCCRTCNTCQNCKQRYAYSSCRTKKLRERIHCIRDFSNLVAHSTLESFEQLQLSQFVDRRFPNCHDFESLSLLCVSYVKEILDYLLTFTYSITQTEYDDLITEMSVIRREDSFKLLEGVYRGPISREVITDKNFKLEFEMREISSWISTSGRFFGFGQSFTERDVDIKSKLSSSIEGFVRSYFESHKIENDSLKLVRVSKTGSNVWPTYAFVLKPTSMVEEEFMTEYRDYRSDKSNELWKHLQDYIRGKISDRLSVDVEFSLYQWTLGSLIITTAIHKENGEWTDSELESLDKVINDSGPQQQHFTDYVFIESVMKMTTGKENSVSYWFKVRCSSSVADGVDNVIKEVSSIGSDGIFKGILAASFPSAISNPTTPSVTLSASSNTAVETPHSASNHSAASSTIAMSATTEATPEISCTNATPSVIGTAGTTQNRGTTSVGAAGTTYSGFEDAGKAICQRHCRDFPKVEESHTVPSLFEKKVLDSIDFLKDPASLTKEEEKCYDGLRKNLLGEESEKLIFDIFNTFSRTKQSSEHFLLMRSVNVDGNCKGQVKRRALFAEFPKLDEMITTKGEFDLMILIRYVGVIVGEIKSNAFPDALAKAETQMHTGAVLVKNLMEVISGGSLSSFPTAKMLLIPGELSPSPEVMSNDGSHVLHQDLCSNIHPTWEKIIDDLRMQKQKSTFTEKDFERLTHVLTGLWAAKPLKRGKGITYDYKTTLEEIDDNIKNQNISSIKKHPTITEVSHFQKTLGGLTLLYLTPQQRQLFDSRRVALVNGNAGSGKSLCIIFKVIDLHEADISSKKLIVAAYPHIYRLERILGENDISVEIITSFPPPTNSKSSVYIISLDQFFGVPAAKLLSYLLHNYHLFVDDLHTYRRMSDEVASFSDIKQFVEQTGNAAQSSRYFVWFCLDPVQGGLYDSDEYSVHLFKQNLTIPVMVLSYVLRNTAEIIEVADDVRSDEIASKTRLNLKGIIESFDAGHGIVSSKVQYHKLQKQTKMQCTDKEYRRRFICQRIGEEIERIAGANYTGAYSHITVLFDLASQLEDNRDVIEKLLMNEFNALTQSIEDLERKGDNNGIVMDEVKNVMSYENMCVIYVKTSHGYDYNAVTRARVILTIIDTTDTPPLVTEKMDMIKWKDDGYNFKLYSI